VFLVNATDPYHLGRWDNVAHRPANPELMTEILAREPSGPSGTSPLHAYRVRDLKLRLLPERIESRRFLSDYDVHGET